MALIAAAAVDVVMGMVPVLAVVVVCEGWLG